MIFIYIFYLDFFSMIMHSDLFWRNSDETHVTGSRCEIVIVNNKDKKMKISYLIQFVCCFSVHLAKRVLQLERANTSLRKERETEEKKTDQLANEVISV